MKEETLNLVLKGQWYMAVTEGDKNEEYRRLSPYWLKRLFRYNTGAPGHPLVVLKDDFWEHFLPREEGKRVKALKRLLEKGFLLPRHNRVAFFHGYSKDRPSASFPIAGIRIGTGRPEWGAIPNENYFVIVFRKPSQNH